MVIQGVYLITNKIDNKKYVGISNDIYHRWTEHKWRAFNKSSQEYNKTLSKAFRKYGLENFEFSILKEEKDANKRKELEKDYIKFYDSYKNGYNDTIGGDGNLRNKLTEQDVIDIRTRYKNLERCMIVYQEYKDRIGRSGFNKIWKGETWKHIMPEIYTPERIHYHKMHTGNSGEWNGRAKLSNEEVRKIQNRYENGETVYHIWLEYKELYPNLDSFRQLVKKERWK